MSILRIVYEDEAQLDRKLEEIMRKRGFALIPLRPRLLTVGELARELGRSPASLSRSLHRPSCPRFDATYGATRKRILKLAVNTELIEFLQCHESRQPR